MSDPVMSSEPAISPATNSGAGNAGAGRVGDHHRVDLTRLQGLVVTADLTPDAGQRYLAAHRALRETAALVLRVRTRSQTPAQPDSRLWALVSRHAPELAEWAGYLSAIQPRHDAAQRGELPISDREADDLVRDAQTFLGLAGTLRVGGVRR